MKGKSQKKWKRKIEKKNNDGVKSDKFKVNMFSRQKKAEKLLQLLRTNK
jgi:hypothetical protein